MPLRNVTIRYLELARDDFKPKRSSRSDVAFVHVDPPLPELNRFLYAAVGADWFWIERRHWTRAQWTEHLLSESGSDTWLLSVAGVPAGYAELRRKSSGVVEIEHIGLLGAFIGQGLGAHLLTSAVERAHELGARTVILNTCELDHPSAIANYNARGFREVRAEVKEKEVPSEAPGPWENANVPDRGRALLRHALAVVAYRGGKSMRGAPGSFATFRAGPASRTPIEIVGHIGDLYQWALTMAVGEIKWTEVRLDTWDANVARFFETLGAVDAFVARGAPIHCGVERLVAGPVADSLTHIGQLAMLRRLAGTPIKGENYAKADIVSGRVGAEQSTPGFEFD